MVADAEPRGERPKRLAHLACRHLALVERDAPAVRREIGARSRRCAGQAVAFVHRTYPEAASERRGRARRSGRPGARCQVWVAGRDVPKFGPHVTIDGATDASPASLATLPPGGYRVQAVLG
jgi:hypothetical protein